MQGILWKLPVFRGLSPRRKGVVDACVQAAATGLFFGVPLAITGFEPSADLLRTSAEIGATLLIASAVVGAYLMQVAQVLPLDEREERLGAFSGVSLLGMVGIAMALFLSESVGHRWSWFSSLLMGFDFASLMLMGAAVVLQPYMTYEWANRDRRATSEDKPS